MGVGVGDVIAGVRDREKTVGRVTQDGVVVGPVIPAGVVQAHAHPGIENGVAQVADDIAARLVAALVRVFQRGGPEAEPVMVFGGQHHVARTRVATEGGDRVHVRTGSAGIKGGNEVVVAGIGTISVTLVVPGRTAFQSAAVEVPLGIGVVPQHLCGTRSVEQLLDIGHLRRPTRH